MLSYCSAPPPTWRALWLELLPQRLMLTTLPTFLSSTASYAIDLFESFHALLSWAGTCMDTMGMSSSHEEQGLGALLPFRSRTTQARASIAITSTYFYARWGSRDHGSNHQQRWWHGCTPRDGGKMKAEGVGSSAAPEILAPATCEFRRRDFSSYGRQPCKSTTHAHLK